MEINYRGAEFLVFLTCHVLWQAQISNGSSSIQELPTENAGLG